MNFNCYVCMYVCMLSFAIIKLKFKINNLVKERNGLVIIFTSVQKLIGKKLKIYLKHPQFKMAEIALNGQRDFVSIMAPPEVFLKRKLFEEKNILSQELREMLHFQDC